MNAKKGNWGGARANSGGARAGAGRKKGTPQPNGKTGGRSKGTPNKATGGEVVEERIPTLRVSKTLKDAIAKIAREEGGTLAGTARKLMEEALKMRGIE